ncbi:hypothetical protein THRCLA_03224 [Thraustotheca clavata]|uniref:Uncharacterized protein n=1 Tax=Thraustotheca clavata TaxID=74557 RepID=A0A1W0A3C6_9STRA|nr:hypothetical protein THRCLA_03224 [Thraustotheca clavata]
MDKKLRDKERKKEQARKSKARERELYRQIHIQSNHLNALDAWHYNESREEEMRIRRYELDIINPYEEHPASAGYILTKAKFSSIADQSDSFNPIFFGYSYARGELIDPFGTTVVFDERRKHPRHPACHGYAMSRHLAEIISPIFMNMDFHKREIGDDFDINLTESSDDKKTYQDPQKNSQELELILRARFDQPQECLVCESSQVPGCPGCWVPSSDFYDRAYHINNPVEEEIEEGEDDFTMMHYYEATSPQQEAQAREAEYIRGLLFDVWAVRKHREKLQHFITIIIKSIPAGSAVELRMDPTSSIKYLYDQYRANFDGFDRKLYILLPTSQGLFLLDETIEAGSEVALGVSNGNLVLNDFQLCYAEKDATPYMLMSVAILNTATTPVMLAHYVKHNFTVECSIDLQLRYHAFEVSTNIRDDRLQRALSRKADVVIASAMENRQISRHYEQLELQKAIKKSRDDKMASLVEHHRQNKDRPRTKKEIRAWSYYNFSMAEPKPGIRLQKLWQCFHKFEELKLTKRGKLLDAAYSDDTCELLSLHRTATMQAFDLFIDKTHRPVLPPIISISSKFGIAIATRLGLTAKEDREYGAELEIIIPQEGDEEEINNTTEKKHKHMTIDAIRAAKHKAFQDMEWRADAKVIKFYNSSDLLVWPFAVVRWDCFASAYLIALGTLDRMKIVLDAYNNLAKAIQNESILKPKEIEQWKLDLSELQNQLETTGALVQACRRLDSKSSLLASRALRHRKAFEKAEEDALLRIKDIDTLPPMSAMEKLKWEFKHKHGIYSPNLRNLTPDMDQVKARVGTAVGKSVEMTKYLAQQAKDNIEILKL